MKHETSSKNHKVPSKEYCPNDSTIIASDYPLCRVVCKLEGNHENPFITIENEKTLKIEKCDEVDGKTVKNQWIFQLNQFYNNKQTLENVLQKEFMETEYFKDFFNGFKSNMILVTNNTSKIFDYKDSILNVEDNVFKVCQNSLDNIFKVKENISQTYGGKKFVTLSIFEIHNDKLSDLIDLTTNSTQQNQKELKIFDHIEETYIDGLVEIKINKPSDFTDIIKLMSLKNNCRKSNQKVSNKIHSTQFKHQIVTIKSYITTRNFQYDEKYLDFKNPDLFKVTSKLNIIIYKAHEILSSGKLLTDRNYIINSAENYKFFSSLKNIQKMAQSFLKSQQIKNTLCSQFRSCKLLRVIKDTFLFNQKNLILAFLPFNVENVILLHDILNSIKPRKMHIDVCENTLINNNNEVSFFCENKENVSICANKQSLINNSQINLEINMEKLQINVKNDSAKKGLKHEEFRLLKNGNKNLWLLFSKFEENLGNQELAYEYSQKGLSLK